ncbi:hypothetical protein BJ684DRAFT_16117, partial [Piptocephalis cylindrospora]
LDALGDDLLEGKIEREREREREVCRGEAAARERIVGGGERVVGTPPTLFRPHTTLMGVVQLEPKVEVEMVHAGPAFLHEMFPVSLIVTNEEKDSVQVRLSAGISVSGVSEPLDLMYEREDAEGGVRLLEENAGFGPFRVRYAVRRDDTRGGEAGSEVGEVTVGGEEWRMERVDEGGYLGLKRSSRDEEVGELGTGGGKGRSRRSSIHDGIVEVITEEDEAKEEGETEEGSEVGTDMEEESIYYEKSMSTIIGVSRPFEAAYEAYRVERVSRRKRLAEMIKRGIRKASMMDVAQGLGRADIDKGGDEGIEVNEGERHAPIDRKLIGAGDEDKASNEEDENEEDEEVGQEEMMETYALLARIRCNGPWDVEVDGVELALEDIFARGIGIEGSGVHVWRAGQIFHANFLVDVVAPEPGMGTGSTLSAAVDLGSVEVTWRRYGMEEGDMTEAELGFTGERVPLASRSRVLEAGGKGGVGDGDGSSVLSKTILGGGGGHGTFTQTLLPMPPLDISAAGGDALRVSFEVPSFAYQDEPFEMAFRLHNGATTTEEVSTTLELGGDGFTYAGYKSRSTVRILPMAEIFLRFNLFPLKPGRARLPRLVVQARRGGVREVPVEGLGEEGAVLFIKPRRFLP